MNKPSLISIIILIAIVAGCAGEKSASVDPKPQGGDIKPPIPVITYTIASPDNILAGKCSQYILNASGPSKDDVSFYASTLSLALFSDSECDRPIGSVTLPANQDSVPFYVLSKKVGSFSDKLTATGNGTALEVKGNTIPSQLLQLSMQSPNGKAGDCRPAKINVADIYGNVATTDRTLALSYGFFTSNKCTEATKISSVAVAGRSVVPLFHRVTGARKHNLTAKSGDLNVADALLQVTIAAGSASHLWMSLPRILVNTCGAGNIRVSDSFGNEVPSPDNITVKITPSKNTKVYLDDDCTGTAYTASSSLKVPIDHTKGRMPVYFKSSAHEQSPVSATLYHSANSHTHLAEFDGKVLVDAAQDARTLAFSIQTERNPDPELKVRSTACTLLEVELRNAGKVPLNVSVKYEPLLSSADGTGRFYNDATCTQATTKAVFNVGTHKAKIYYKDPTTSTTEHVETVHVTDDARVVSTDGNDQGMYGQASLKIIGKK